MAKLANTKASHNFSYRLNSFFSLLSEHPWSVLILVTIGGVLVTWGLRWEMTGEKEEYASIQDARWCKKKRKIGEWFVLAGVFIETVVAGVMAGKDIWEASQTKAHLIAIDPRNQPIISISAVTRFVVKGDKYAHSSITDPMWQGWLTFCKGNSISNKMFFLSASKGDVSLNNILGGNTDREYIISFHTPPSSSFFNSWPGMGKPAETFDDIGAFVVQIPQLDTNNDVQVISGSIDVTVNASLAWRFEIPAEKQRFGVISGQRTTNAASKVETIIFPVTIEDWGVPNPQLHSFDGK